MRRPIEDVRTVAEIARKKRLVKAALRASASRCKSGLWYVEGPYARHQATIVPSALKDAIRGIRKRQTLREVVERLLPPWYAYVPVSSSPRTIQCSIAYMSNGGNWKLFDLDSKTIWTRPARPDSVEREIRNLERFGRYFNIPAWDAVRDNGQLWRRDHYVSDQSLSQCDVTERLQVVKSLLRQYEKFAKSEAISPSPELTNAAIGTMLQVAPLSLPARIATEHATEMQTLAAKLSLVPCHGDLSAQNVFVADKQAWIIDWDNAGHFRPSLSDPLYLILREADLGRPDLLAAFLSGQFDAEILRILALSGLSGAPCSNLVLLVHAYLIHFHQKRIAGQRDAHRQNVDDLWEPLLGYFSGTVNAVASVKRSAPTY